MLCWAGLGAPGHGCAHELDDVIAVVFPKLKELAQRGLSKGTLTGWLKWHANAEKSPLTKQHRLFLSNFCDDKEWPKVCGLAEVLCLFIYPGAASPCNSSR